MFLGNICMYSYAIGLVTHMLDCHDWLEQDTTELYASEGI